MKQKQTNKKKTIEDAVLAYNYHSNAIFYNNYVHISKVQKFNFYYVALENKTNF